jgi:formylmethanofuran dehydrogenase subunit D
MTAAAHPDLATHIAAFQRGDSVSVTVEWGAMVLTAERTEVGSERHYFTRRGKHLIGACEPQPVALEAP